MKAHDGEVPPGALEAGKSEDNEVLYVGRVDDGEKLVLGKVRMQLKEFSLGLATKALI